VTKIDTYDKVLAGMFASLSAGAFLGILTKIPLHYAAGSGAAVSMLVMYYGMFENGPVG